MASSGSGDTRSTLPRPRRPPKPPARGGKQHPPPPGTSPTPLHEATPTAAWPRLCRPGAPPSFARCYLGTEGARGGTRERRENPEYNGREVRPSAGKSFIPFAAEHLPFSNSGGSAKAEAVRAGSPRQHRLVSCRRDRRGEYCQVYPGTLHKPPSHTRQNSRKLSFEGAHGVWLV